MPKLKLDDKIAATKQQLATLTAQQKARDEKERQRLKAAKRKAEVRAPIVVMALLRKMAETDTALAEKIREAANQITRAGDRAAAVLAGYLEPEKEPKPKVQTEADREARLKAACDGAGEDEAQQLELVRNAIHRLEEIGSHLTKRAIIGRLKTYERECPGTDHARIRILAQGSPYEAFILGESATIIAKRGS